MSKDKINQEPKLEELSGDDLDQVQGGKAAGYIGETEKNLSRNLKPTRPGRNVSSTASSNPDG